MKTVFCWNLSGGYRHASQHSIEGFYSYNDSGICYRELIIKGALVPEDKILIIDTDAHHGNGNARTFMENNNIRILDIYNKEIYPATPSTRQRVDVRVGLGSGTTGLQYLERYQQGLAQLTNGFRLAFVVAGTNVLASDKLGGFQLSIDDVVQREKITLNFFKQKQMPAVMLSGGGYSKASATAIAKSIIACL